MTHLPLVLAVTTGMIGAAAVGWRVGQIMSPRPDELRGIAKDLERIE